MITQDNIYKQNQQHGCALRDLSPLRAAPVDGLQNGPPESVRASDARVPNERTCLSLDAPTTPASHHRRTRSLPVSLAVDFVGFAL